jgi:hypothetical protein
MDLLNINIHFMLGSFSQYSLIIKTVITITGVRDSDNYNGTQLCSELRGAYIPMTCRIQQGCANRRHFSLGEC